MRQFLAAVTALLVLAGVVFGAWYLLDLGGGTDGSGEEAEQEPGSTAAATAAAYAAAWSAGDHLTMAGLVRDPPPTFAAPHQQLREGLEPTQVVVEVADVAEDVDGRASAIMNVAVSLPLDNAPVVEWNVDLTLLRERGEWGIEWDITSVHPDLRDGLVFDLDAEPVGRSPILAEDGTELAGSGTRVLLGFAPGAVTDPEAVVDAFETAFPGSGATAERILARDDLVDEWFYEVITVTQEAADTASPTLREANGILRQTESGRTLYDDRFAIHVVGRYEEATAEDLERLGAPYEVGDEVGRTGLEREFEGELTGSDELSVVLRDRSDDAVRAVLATFQEQPSGPVTTTLDIEVQRAIETALGETDTTIGMVAIDATSGAIRGSASRPLSGYNRAFEGRYPPGSAFKIVTAEALLADGITPDSSVACPGDTVVGGLAVTNAGNLALGTTSMTSAFARSCNTTFAELGAGLGTDAMTAAAERFGFGVEPLSPLVASGGSFPEPTDTAELAAAAFGQARVTASPLHLASMAAATVTGVWHQPYLLVEDGPGETRQLSSGVREPLQAMMRAVVTDGTGTEAEVADDLEVRGKTGTAQAQDGIEHAWFVGTYGDLGFAVLVEGGGSGGQVAAPIARRFVEALISLREEAEDPIEDVDGSDGATQDGATEGAGDEQDG